jgi:hypothetical protein
MMQHVCGRFFAAASFAREECRVEVRSRANDLSPHADDRRTEPSIDAARDRGSESITGADTLFVGDSEDIAKPFKASRRCFVVSCCATWTSLS